MPIALNHTSLSNSLPLPAPVYTPMRVYWRCDQTKVEACAFSYATIFTPFRIQNLRNTSLLNQNVLNRQSNPTPNAKPACCVLSLPAQNVRISSFLIGSRFEKICFSRNTSSRRQSRASAETFNTLDKSQKDVPGELGQEIGICSRD